ncbi:MAG: hypothetical protein ACE5HO_13940 [bacterium]
MKLLQRDKRALRLGALFLLALMVYQFAVQPTLSKLTTLDRLIPRKQKNLLELRQMGGKYQTMVQQIRQWQTSASESATFGALSFLENQARQVLHKDNLISLKPATANSAGEVVPGFKKSAFEVELEKVSVEELVTFLYQVENAQHPMKITDLHLKPNFDPAQGLDATVKVISFEPGEAVARR